MVVGEYHNIKRDNVTFPDSIQHRIALIVEQKVRFTFNFAMRSSYEAE